MKKLLLSVSLACLLATPANAAPYISGSVGAGFPDNSDVTYVDGSIDKSGLTSKTGVPFGGAVGIKSDAYRLEVALGYQTNKIDTWQHSPDLYNDSFSFFSYMVNGYYDVDIKNSSISPYVMAGLGGARVNVKNEGYADQTSNVFAWQVGAGIGIKAATHLTVDLGYRYLKPSSFNDNWGTYTFSSSNFLAGIRYEFN